MTSPLRDNPALKARLERLKAEVRKATALAVPRITKTRLGPGTASIRGRVLVAFLFLAKVGLVIAFPFVLLVGGSVWLYSRTGMPTWLALILSVAATGAVIAWYVVRVTQTLHTPVRFKFVATRIGLPLVLVYCGYSLLYLSRVNAKSDDVRQYYTAVHPLLRVAITTATVFDREFVVTDMARTPEDYDRTYTPWTSARCVGLSGEIRSCVHTLR